MPQAFADYRAFSAGHAEGSPEPLLKDARTRIAALQ